MKSILILAFCFFIVRAESQNSISATYVGLIPTSYNIYDESCNGQSATLSVTLPAGESYNVTSVDVVYNMTGFGSGWKSHQRSKIKLENNNVEEATEAAGIGDATGTQAYSRSISVFNGTYGGGTVLTFQMKTRRTHEGVAGCHNSINRVDGNTWTITVNYSNEVFNPKVGVNTSSPSQSMDVGGKLKLGDDSTAPLAGTVRWNTTTQDFEGYNGTEWLSFTKSEGGNWGNTTITENQNFPPSDGGTNDQFGGTVGISDDYAIVGAYLKNVGNNVDQGKVYVFKKTGNTWTEDGFLLASDGSQADYFGTSVAINGEYAIVGAHYSDVNGNGNQGRAYIFKRNGSTWTEQANITAFDGAAEDNFGWSVDISNDYAIIGANNKNVGANVDQGKVYMYKRTNTTWSLDAQFLASDGTIGDRFGNSVAMTDIYAIVGANQKIVNGNFDQGKVYVYKKTGSIWALQTTMVASDGNASDFFGKSVAISNDYAIVGAIGKEYVSNDFQGKVYIYKRTNNVWGEQAGIIASDGAENDYFGNDVSISGDNIVVGAYSKIVNNNNGQGKVYIFNRVGNSWLQQSAIIASDGNATDYFGNSVGISGNNVIVGSPFKNVGSSADQGKVYFFNK